MAAGVPVVQPNVGGYPEFIEETGGGIIYEPNDGENLAQAMASLLSEPDRACELAERGRKAVREKYTMNDMAKNMVAVYERVLNDQAI